MKAPHIIYTDGKNTCASAPAFSNIDGNVKYIRADLVEGQRKQAEDEHGKGLLYVCQKTAEREYRNGVREGKAQAKKELGWHSVNESLPPVDEEVIVLSDSINGKTVEGANHISFGHRVREEGTVVTNVLTGNSFFMQPKSYNGWNIPGITHWMYLPKMEEE